MVHTSFFCSTYIYTYSHPKPLPIVSSPYTIPLILEVRIKPCSVTTPTHTDVSGHVIAPHPRTIQQTSAEYLVFIRREKQPLLEGNWTDGVTGAFQRTPGIHYKQQQQQQQQHKQTSKQQNKSRDTLQTKQNTPLNNKQIRDT